jgi:hypothetical protein
MGALYELAVNGGIPLICVGAGMILSAVGLVNELASFLTWSHHDHKTKGTP